ncbi:hypothetical protein Taro_050540, partial [Colocasia esculenta]|nr:hypothetical protein [Colocasia esculenta]
GILFLLPVHIEATSRSQINLQGIWDPFVPLVLKKPEIFSSVHGAGTAADFDDFSIPGDPPPFTPGLSWQFEGGQVPPRLCLLSLSHLLLTPT